MDLQGWPTGSTAALATEPTNLLPGRIEGWPAGSQRDGTLATDLLAQAVAWWDASAYRDGDRFLRNRGIAGELLDLRLGSSVVANTNDPTWLGPEATGYVYLPGVASNYLSVPDENALDITGDIDIRVRVALDDWIQAADASLITKWAVTNSVSWIFQVRGGARTLRFYASTTGANALGAESTATIGYAIGEVAWVRVTRSKSAGEVKFWTSADGSAWTQLGSTITGFTTADIYAGTSSVEVGTRSAGASDRCLGKFYRAIVKDGIDGTTVLDVDCDAITSGSATSFTAVTGQTVTINRSTSGRKSVAVPARRLGGRPCFLLGTDDMFEVPAESVWQQQLLNFGQGDSFTVLAVVRQWATQVTNARYLSKRANGAGGYVIGPGNTSNGVQFYVEAGTSAPTATQTLGQVSSLVATRTERQAALYVNGVASIASGPSARITSAVPFAVGREGGSGVNYADMEFTAAAIFRRALTPAEIATITTYYTTGG